MSRPPRKPPANAYRKVDFREEARAIVFKDRYDRKYGRAVDTAGTIARALERAYKQGFADAQDPHRSASPVTEPTAGPLEWGFIPPRPRNAFWSCCLFIIGRQGNRLRLGHLEPALTERGTQGWRLVVEGYEPELKDVISASSIRPLVKLGLLESAPSSPERLTISARGRATWELYLLSGELGP